MVFNVLFLLCSLNRYLKQSKKGQLKEQNCIKMRKQATFLRSGFNKLFWFSTLI